jgi:putative membrane protein
MEYLRISAFVGTLVYSFVGILILCLAFWIIDKLTPYDLWKELVEHRNQALATAVAGMFIAIAIIIAAAVHG